VEATLETEAQNKPRFRNDLVAQQLEEEGVQYVDVTDPNSGATFRFYDVEYSIACGMNGERDLSELVDWARADLGIETTPDELATVMSTLAELGYLDAGLELGPSGSPTTDEEHEFAPELELGAPGGRPDEQRDTMAEGTPTPELELGAPGAAAMSDVHAQRTRPVEAIELGPPGGTPEAVPTNGAGGSSGAVELGAEDLEEYKSQVTEMPRAPTASPPPPPGTDDDMSFAGLMDADGMPVAKKIEAKAPSIPRSSADHTPTPPPPIEITADAPPESKRPTTVKFDADEPTNLPGAMPDDDDDDVSVDLSAHISLDKHEVEEAVRASKVMMVPEIPSELLRESDSDVDKTQPAMPLPPPPSTSQVPAIVTDDALRRAAMESAATAVATPLPERPIAAVSSRPIEPSAVPQGAVKGKKSGAGGMLFFLLVLALGGGFAVWYFGFRGDANQGTGETPAGKSGEVTPPATETQPGVAPVGTQPPVASAPAARLSERTGSVTEAKAPAAGRVAWTAPDGKDIAANEAIVKFQGFQRWEQQKANALTRLDFYQGELDKAKAANNAVAVDKDEKKVQEKKDLITQAETELFKLLVVAPVAGKLELVAKVGAPVEAGGVVAKISGGGPQLVASFDAAATAPGYQAGGANCQVAAKGAPDKRSACVIESVEGSKVNVRIVDGSPFKAGDDVELQPAK